MRCMHVVVLEKGIVDSMAIDQDLYPSLRENRIIFRIVERLHNVDEKFVAIAIC